MLEDDGVLLVCWLVVSLDLLEQGQGLSLQHPQDEQAELDQGRGRRDGPCVLEVRHERVGRAQSPDGAELQHGAGEQDFWGDFRAPVV